MVQELDLQKHQLLFWYGESDIHNQPKTYPLRKNPGGKGGKDPSEIEEREKEKIILRKSGEKQFRDQKWEGDFKEGNYLEIPCFTDNLVKAYLV